MNLQPTFELSPDGRTSARSSRQSLELLSLSCRKVPELFAYYSADTRNNAFLANFEPFMFTSLLLAHIYKNFVLCVTHQYDFAWDMSLAPTNIDGIIPLVRSYMRSPRTYNEEDVDAVLAGFFRNHDSYTNPTRFGFITYDNVFIRIDAVVRRNNVTIPVIVVSEKLRKPVTYTSYNDMLRSKAAATNDWVGRLDEDNDLVYNRRHPSYILITLAMHAIDTNVGIVIHYDGCSKTCTEFNVVANSEHRRIIMQRAFFCMRLYCDYVQAEVRVPIPYLTIKSDDFDLERDDDDVHFRLIQKRTNTNLPWARYPYNSITTSEQQQPPRRSPPLALIHLLEDDDSDEAENNDDPAIVEDSD